MAHAGVVLDLDHFNCSVCLDVLKSPVTIPCGHSYCHNCIQNYWDQDDYLGVFACPQCRQAFNPRPPLARNTMLADVVEKFKETRIRETSSPPPAAERCLAGSGDVECDVCAGRKNRAVKSCLVCLASYCDAHVQPHYESAAFKKHRLVSASQHLRETICPVHDKLLEVYCRTDRRCICYLCLTDEHKGHDTALADAEIHQIQRELDDMKQIFHMRIQQREKAVQELKEAVLSLTRSARTAAEESDSVFTELIRSAELKRFEVRELIKAQEKSAVGEAEQLLDKIQKDIADLKSSQAKLEQLCQTEEPVCFFQIYQSLPAPPVLSASPSLPTDPSLSFGPTMTALSDFKGLMQEVCQGGFVSIYERVRDVTIVGSENPPAQSNTTAAGPFRSAPQPETSVGAAAPQDLNQTSTNNLNPFLPPGSTKPIFAFSPFGKCSDHSTYTPFLTSADLIFIRKSKKKSHTFWIKVEHPVESDIKVGLLVAREQLFRPHNGDVASASAVLFSKRGEFLLTDSSSRSDRHLTLRREHLCVSVFPGTKLSSGARQRHIRRPHFRRR